MHFVTSQRANCAEGELSRLANLVMGCIHTQSDRELTDECQRSTSHSHSQVSESTSHSGPCYVNDMMHARLRCTI